MRQDGVVVVKMVMVVMGMGTDIPGGYTGMGIVGMGKDTLFCTRYHTCTHTCQTRTHCDRFVTCVFYFLYIYIYISFIFHFFHYLFNKQHSSHHRHTHNYTTTTTTTITTSTMATSYSHHIHHHHLHPTSPSS